MKSVKKLVTQIGKYLIPKDTAFYDWAHQTFVQKPGPIYSAIEKRSRGKKHFLFLQVGANDGRSSDPLHKLVKRRKWNGVLVEPVKYLFQRLEETHKDRHSGLFLENAAVGMEEGEMPFFYFKHYESSEGKPWWLEQLGSFNRAHIEGTAEKYQAEIIEERIPCITIKGIMDKYNLPGFDLIQIDTEGYDYEIIKTIDFAFSKPKMIYYEHRHLSPEDRNACKQLLKSQSYAILEEEFDTLAYLPF